MLDHIATHKAGEYGYYDERERGTVRVRHDSNVYVYRKPWKGLRKFKMELLAAFSNRCEARISGRYPEYSIDTVC